MLTQGIFSDARGLFVVVDEVVEEESSEQGGPEGRGAARGQAQAAPGQQESSLL